MHDPTDHRRLLCVGSLCSGYDAETIWFPENNQHVARIFAHRWPDAPNLGDIMTVDWRAVEPVDVLCGGFPFRTH